MKAKGFAVFLLLFSMAAQAATGLWQEGVLSDIGRDTVPPGITLQKLADLTSDRNMGDVALSLMLEKNLVAGFYGERHATNEPVEGVVYWQRDIEKPAGVSLLQVAGRDAAFLNGLLDRATQEGRFTIRYLANGITMRYESCDFLLKKGGDKWHIQNIHTGAKVPEIRVTTWSFGITTLEGICK